MKQWLKYFLFFIMFLLFFPHSVYAEDGKCISGNCINGVGTMTYYDGGKYVGEWKEGMPNGQGTYTNSNIKGFKYVGKFKDDKFNG